MSINIHQIIQILTDGSGQGKMQTGEYYDVKAFANTGREFHIFLRRNKKSKFLFPKTQNNNNKINKQKQNNDWNQTSLRHFRTTCVWYVFCLQCDYQSFILLSKHLPLHTVSIIDLLPLFKKTPTDSRGISFFSHQSSGQAIQSHLLRPKWRCRPFRVH